MLRVVNWKYSGPMPCCRQWRSCATEMPYFCSTMSGEMRAITVPFACPMPRCFRHARKHLTGEGIGKLQPPDRGIPERSEDMPRKPAAETCQGRTGQYPQQPKRNDAVALRNETRSVLQGSALHRAQLPEMFDTLASRSKLYGYVP